MAYPDKPQILTSYTAEEQSIGNGTLPGQELDVDFASLKASMEQVIDFVKLFTRSDGQLANGIVTAESLAASVRIGFDPPSPWATGQEYTTRSTVFSGFGFYLCTVAHTSGANFAIDLASGRWQLLADLTPPGGALIAANNLSDLTNAVAARASLGLGTVATDSIVPVSRGGTGGTDAATARTNLGVTLNNLGVTLTAAQINAAGQLAGRNRIINGQGRINQRVYVSGTNTVGANQYTLDRWRVVVSGQNLTFTGSDAGRTMTAPAGGVEQVIEGADIEGGTYVLNWTGTASATVNGTSRAKGETFTLTANTNATVRFTSGTFTDVQLELGTIPTPFERLPLADELARCQRYFEVIQGDGVVATGQAWSATAAYAAIPYKVEKRATPVITLPALGVVSGTATFLNASGARVSTGSLSVPSANVSQAVVAITGTSGLVAGNASNFFADAADIFISAEL